MHRAYQDGGWHANWIRSALNRYASAINSPSNGQYSRSTNTGYGHRKTQISSRIDLCIHQLATFQPTVADDRRSTPAGFSVFTQAPFQPPAGRTAERRICSVQDGTDNAAVENGRSGYVMHQLRCTTERRRVYPRPM
jgi:hypothetical protein